MLVFSRKAGEEIVLPGLGVSIKLVKVHHHRVRLGICAPRGVAIVRKEPMEKKVPSRSDGKVCR